MKNNILIVEDEMIIAYDLKDLLEDFNYKVCDIISKGEDVLPAVEKHNPDLILMDISIRGNISGIDAAKILYENNYNIPIIYCSGEINKERLEKIKLPNTYGFIIKPIHLDSLHTTIELSLDKAKLERKLRKTKEELEQTNEELLKSKQSYANLFTRSIEGICLHELVYDDDDKVINYRILDVNLRYEKTLKLKRKDVLNKLATEVYNTNDPPYVDIYKSVAETGKPYVFDTYFTPMDKHFSISVFSPKKGQFATSFRDITEQKKQEYNNELKNAVLNNTSAVIYVKDLNGKFLFVNKQFETSFSISSKEILGKTDFELMPEELAEKYRKNDLDIINKQKAINYEEVAIIDNNLHTALSTKFPISIRDQVVGIGGVSTDITEQKKIDGII